MFLPWSNKACQLPNIPDQRSKHVQLGKILCGGNRAVSRIMQIGEDLINTDCMQWNATEGKWDRSPIALSGHRAGASSWSRGNNMVIMGGWNDGDIDTEMTSEVVLVDRVKTKRSFQMKYSTK